MKIKLATEETKQKFMEIVVPDKRFPCTFARVMESISNLNIAFSTTGNYSGEMLIMKASDIKTYPTKEDLKLAYRGFVEEYRDIYGDKYMAIEAFIEWWERERFKSSVSSSSWKLVRDDGLECTYEDQTEECLKKIIDILTPALSA